MVSSRILRSSLSLLLSLVILTGCQGFTRRAYLPTPLKSLPAKVDPTPTITFTLAAPSLMNSIRYLHQNYSNIHGRTGLLLKMV